MSNVISHVFHTSVIRTVEVDAVPMFIAKDVAEALGYSNTAKAVAAHCKRTSRFGMTSSSGLGGKQEMIVIPESDVYRLVMKSKLPQAEAFQDWVTEVVLPSIRKTGSYSTANDATFATPKTYAAAFSLGVTERL